MSESASPSVVHSNFGVLSASDSEFNSGSASATDSDFEVVLVTQATASLALSDSDSGSLVSAPTDLTESSDDEQIFVSNIIRSAPNTPRPPARAFAPPRLAATPRPIFTQPIVETGHDSDASDREDGSSISASSYDSGSGSDDGVHARSRTLTITHDRLEAPISLRPSSNISLGTVHSNASAATIRPASSTPLARVPSNRTRRSAPAGMHTPAITTNTISGILAAAPLSPPTPSDGGEIPYAPFTPAPTAVPAPAPVPAPVVSAPPSVPAGKVTKKQWAAMNIARLKLGFAPLQHVLRKQHNAEVKTSKKKKNKKDKKAKAKADKQAQPQAPTTPKPKSKSKSKPKPAANPLVAPRPTVGASPTSSEDEGFRARASMFSPVNDMSVRSDSPDEEAYDEAIRQLDEHMSSPPEHPTAAYRYLLNRALLLEFRICTPDTLPTSHGAAIAMVKDNVHINVLDYVAKRKEGFAGLHSAMLASAKALRKDVRKRRMPAKAVKSLGLHSLLIHQ